MNKSIYSNEYKFLIKQLKKSRIDSGLTQKDVAEMLKKTQSYVSKVESGQLRIDVIQLKEFAKLYKRDIDYFLK